MLVMQTYHSKVLPQCPQLCSCDIIHFTAKIYTLLVNCTGKGLTEFPLVPLDTTILDLSNNQLSDSSYLNMDVDSLNYNDIIGLILSNNHFTYLDNKFLKMRLHRFLKVDGNGLKEVPYDISLKIQRYATEISLGNNPWVCVCNSEINNMNLLHRLVDLDSVRCSEQSLPEQIIGYKIRDVDPQVLCPPSDKGAKRELVLRIVCVSLALLIVIVLTKLVYDYWRYKRQGTLPWIVYKMP